MILVITDNYELWKGLKTTYFHFIIMKRMSIKRKLKEEQKKNKEEEKKKNKKKKMKKQKLI